QFSYQINWTTPNSSPNTLNGSARSTIRSNTSGRWKQTPRRKCRQYQSTALSNRRTIHSPHVRGGVGGAGVAGMAGVADAAVVAGVADGAGSPFVADMGAPPTKTDQLALWQVSRMVARLTRQVNGLLHPADGMEKCLESQNSS